MAKGAGRHGFTRSQCDDAKDSDLAMLTHSNRLGMTINEKNPEESRYFWQEPKNFGDTMSNEGLAQWRELLLREYGMVDLTVVDKKFKLPKPWDKPKVNKHDRRMLRLKKRAMPKIVKIFMGKMVDKALKTKSDHGTLTKALRALFMRFDNDSDGRINYAELQHGIRSVLGMNMSQAEQDEICKFYDVDGSGTITYAEMIEEANMEEALRAPWANDVAVDTARHLIGKRPGKPVRDFRRRLKEVAGEVAEQRGCGAEAGLRYFFAAIDHDGNGRLQRREFEDCVRKMGLRFDEDAFQQVFKWYDVDDRGTASCQELVSEFANTTIVETSRTPGWFKSEPSARHSERSSSRARALGASTSLPALGNGSQRDSQRASQRASQRSSTRSSTRSVVEDRKRRLILEST